MTAESGMPTSGPSGRSGPPAANDRSDRPARRDPALLRISDGERQEFIDHLTRHCAAGRLTFDELDERIERAWSARTQAELSPLGDDLPALAPTQPATPTLQSWLGDGKALLMTVPTRVLVAGGMGLILVFMLLFLFAAHPMVDGGGR